MSRLSKITETVEKNYVQHDFLGNALYLKSKKVLEEFAEHYKKELESEELGIRNMYVTSEDMRRSTTYLEVHFLYTDYNLENNINFKNAKNDKRYHPLQCLCAKYKFYHPSEGQIHSGENSLYDFENILLDFRKYEKI